MSQPNQPRHPLEYLTEDPSDFADQSCDLAEQACDPVREDDERKAEAFDLDLTALVQAPVELPKIDEYVEDLIDPGYGSYSSRQVVRAAADKMLAGFNGLLWTPGKDGKNRQS